RSRFGPGASWKESAKSRWVPTLPRGRPRRKRLARLAIEKAPGRRLANPGGRGYDGPFPPSRRGDESAMARGGFAPKKPAEPFERFFLLNKSSLDFPRRFREIVCTKCCLIPNWETFTVSILGISHPTP